MELILTKIWYTIKVILCEGVKMLCKNVHGDL